jgi:hypothetical protein
MEGAAGPGHRDFLMTVNLAMFQVVDAERVNSKRLPSKELMVLLEKRDRAPFRGCWLFPYAAVDAGESLDDAVYKKLTENTNHGDIYFEQLYTWGAIDRDPTARVVATSYIAIVPAGRVKARVASGHGELRWFSVSKKLVSNEKISDLHTRSKYLVTLFSRPENVTISYHVIEDASVSGFEKRIKYSYEPYADASARMGYDHIKVLDYALDRIKNKVLYTNIAFGLLPEYFTLTELQQVYEVLLGRNLIKPNFRQMIGKKVEKTQKTKKDGAYRPSALYRLKKSSMIELPEVLE